MTIGIILLAITQPNAASAKSVTCLYPKDQKLVFEVPKKLTDLPSIDFDYPTRVTEFSFRDGNLLLIAMDDAERSRIRMVISAQRDRATGAYVGQIVTDTGGNQLMFDNNQVECKVRD
ncbi:hypothetical protein [Rhizobium sp. BR 314]|uniref:hypothetical protein n=1 Tax=Rhizobium sp. BR 314 TaxID=3040013 RepID=UPI0039BFF9D5